MELRPKGLFSFPLKINSRISWFGFYYDLWHMSMWWESRICQKDHTLVSLGSIDIDHFVILLHTPLSLRQASLSSVHVRSADICLYYVPKCFIYIASNMGSRLSSEARTIVTIVYSLIPAMLDPLTYCWDEGDQRNVDEEILNGGDTFLVNTCVYHAFKVDHHCVEWNEWKTISASKIQRPLIHVTYTALILLQTPIAYVSMGDLVFLLHLYLSHPNVSV